MDWETIITAIITTVFTAGSAQVLATFLLKSAVSKIDIKSNITAEKAVQIKDSVNLIEGKVTSILTTAKDIKKMVEETTQADEELNLFYAKVNKIVGDKLHLLADLKAVVNELLEEG